MEAENKLQVYSDGETLAIAAAGLTIKIAKNAIEKHGRFTMALSGGHSPDGLYKKLSELPFRDAMPWDKTFIFWSDERFVPANDPQNNAMQAMQLLLNHVHIPPTHVFPIYCFDSPAMAATKYEKTILDFFGDEAPRFDLILLGLGENGHTASLFPGSTALKEDKRLIKEVFVDELNMFRITMAIPLINHAHNIIFLVTGNSKAEILEKVIEGKKEPGIYPAQFIRPGDGNLYWLMDAPASTHLKL